MAQSGAYCLCIRVEGNLTIRIGALGELDFVDGFYVYVGSAMNGLKSRIKRHINTSRGIYRAIHWHLDYLLKEEGVSIQGVFTRLSDVKVECDIANSVSVYGEPVRNFGSSDCGCPSHLFRVEECSFLAHELLKIWLIGSWAPICICRWCGSCSLP